MSATSDHTRFARAIARHWRARTPRSPMPRSWRAAARRAVDLHPELVGRPRFVSALCFALSLSREVPSLRGRALRILALAADVLPVLKRFARDRGTA